MDKSRIYDHYPQLNCQHRCDCSSLYLDLFFRELFWPMSQWHVRLTHMHFYAQLCTTPGTETMFNDGRRIYHHLQTQFLRLTTPFHTILTQNDRSAPVESRSKEQLRSLVVILRLMTDFIDAHWEAVEFGVSEMKDFGTTAAAAFAPADDDETNASLYAESTDGQGFIHTDKERYFSTRPPKINPNLVKRTLGLIITIKPKIAVREEMADLQGGNLIGDHHIALPDAPLLNRYATHHQTPSSPQITALLAEIEYNCNRAIRFLSATNWDEVYALTKSKLAVLKLPPQNEDLESLQLTELASLLFLDKATLLPVLKDTWSLIPHIRRPACQQLSLSFLRKSIRHWMVCHSRDLAFIDQVDHLASVEAQGFFNYIYTLSNQQQQGNMKPCTYQFLTTLILLVPSSFAAFNSKRVLGAQITESTEVAFLRHLKNSLNSNGKAFNIAVSCVSEIVACAQLVWQYNREAPVIHFAQKVYPDLYNVLFASGHKVSFITNFDDLQSGFVSSYLHLNQAAVRRDVLPMISSKTVQARYLQNVVRGISRSCSGVHGSPLDAPAFQDAYQLLVQMVTQKSIRHAVLETSSTPTPDQERERISLASILRDSFTFFDQSFESHEASLQQKYLFAEGSNIILPIVNAMLSEDLTLSRDASAFASKLLDPRNLEKASQDHSEQLDNVINMYRSVGLMIRVLCEKIVNPNVKTESLSLIKRRILFSKLEGYLDARCYMAEQYDYIKLENSEGIVIEKPENRLATSRAAEVVILMALASPDMKLNVLSLRCLCIVVKEASLTENVNFISNPSATSFTIAKNFTVYTELCQQIYALTGPAALQKRLRKYLQRVDYPSESITSVWKEIEKRWQRLNNIFYDSTDPEITLLINQWRNYSGFLASLSGCFVRSSSSQFADNPAVQIIREHVYEFLQTMVGFMVSPSAVVRETACEVLAIDASPLAYHHVFSELDTLINKHIDTTSHSAADLLLPEQVAAFVKSVLSRVNAEEFYVSVDLGALTLRIAKHLESLPDEPHVIRLKLRVSMLAQSIAKLQEGLNIRHNAIYRTSIVRILSQWFRSVALEDVGPQTGTPHKPQNHAQRQKSDLAVASITAMALSLESLELETMEESIEADGGVSSKIAAFAMHFNMLLKTIDKFSPEKAVYMQSGVVFSKDKVAIIREKTIQALSNLISSNADVGLKFALPLGLHKDTRLRMAFLEVFKNMVGQKLRVAENLSDHEQYSKLVEFLLSNMDITYLICDNCPGTEVDTLSTLLLNLAALEGRSLELLKGVITREIQAAPSAPEVLRRNCVATRMLSRYARSVASDYLMETLKPIFSSISLQESSAEGSIGQQQQVLQDLVDAFPATLEKAPLAFRQICHTIWTVFEARFSNSSPVSAAGAFVFLRFFCPAIVSPEAEGLVKNKLTGESRKSCLQLAKVLQNMANNSSAVAHKVGGVQMDRKFLEQQTAKISKFLRDLSLNFDTNQSVSEMDPSGIVEYSSQVGLHKFLYTYWEDIYHRIALDKRYKKLLRSHLPEDVLPIDVDSEAVAKRSKELTSLLAGMRKPKAFYSEQVPLDSSHASEEALLVPIRQFIQKNMLREVSLKAQRAQVVHMAVRKDGIPVIVINSRMHDPKTMDTEYLLYRFFQVASKLWYSKFAVVTDVTSYSNKNQFSVHMFKSIAQMAPPAMLNNCIGLYFLNCAAPFCSRLKFITDMFRTVKFLNPDRIPWRFLDPRNISDEFDINSLSLFPYSVAQLSESGYEFNGVIQKGENLPGSANGEFGNSRKVDFKVGDTFLRILACEVIYPFPEAPLRTVDTVNLLDVDRVVETEDGFIVHRRDQSAAMDSTVAEPLVFVSPRKSEIARTVKELKARAVTSGEDKELCEGKQIVKPEDVIPNLLNIGLRSLVSDDNGVRTTAYGLLCLLQSSFGLDFGQHLMPCEGLGVPHLSLQLAAFLSEEIAITRPEMTYDFLMDFFVAYESVGESKKQEVIAYASPWIRNIYQYVYVEDEENGTEKTSRLIRRFCDITYTNPANYHCFVHQFWKVLSQEDELAPILVSEIVTKVAFWQAEIAEDINSITDEVRSKIENMVSLLTTFPSIALCGRIAVATRAIVEVPISAHHRKLSKHPNWDELGILTRVCREIFFNAPVLVEEYLPDICFVVSLFIDAGSLQFRQSLYHLFVNATHSFTASEKLSDHQLGKLTVMLAAINEPKTRLLFGLHADNYSDNVNGFADVDTIVANVDYLESCCSLLLDLLDIVGDRDQANIWRTRWITFVARAAFNDSPAVQGRALVLLGCLAKTEVEDDMVRRIVDLLIQQMALDDGQLSRDMCVCTISCLTKMVGGIDPRSSIYCNKLFWIALACIRASETTEVFNAAMGLLEAVLKSLDRFGDFLNGGLAEMLMPAIENDIVWSEFDAMSGIKVTKDYFETAVCATILRGLQKSVTRPSTLSVLETLLEVSAKNYVKTATSSPAHHGGPTEMMDLEAALSGVTVGPTGMAHLAASGTPPIHSMASSAPSGSTAEDVPPYLCYLFFLHLCSRSKSKLKSYYWLAGFPDIEHELAGNSTSYRCPDMLWSYVRSSNPATVFTLALGAQLFKNCEDDEVMEMRYLGVLSTAATNATSKFLQVYSDVRPKLASHCSATLNVALLSVVTEVVCKVFAIPDISDQVVRGREELVRMLERVQLSSILNCVTFSQNFDYATVRKAAARSMQSLQPHKYY